MRTIIVPSIEVHTRKPAVHLVVARSRMALTTMMSRTAMRRRRTLTTTAMSIEAETKKLSPSTKSSKGQEVYSRAIDVHVQLESVYMSTCLHLNVSFGEMSPSVGLTGQYNVWRPN